jgi:DNA integrity scanning protein DisA with diadenylate cyclase activity
MLDDLDLPRWLRRLADELDDDGIVLPGDERFQLLVLEELDHCRRTPVFEGRRPAYGAMILPQAASQSTRDTLVDHIGYDIVPVDGDIAQVRAYADGRSSYVVRIADGRQALGCFDRAMLFEADLVRVQQILGATFVQRTPVLDVVRVVIDGAIVKWDGRNWQARPTAAATAGALVEHSPELDHSLAELVLELAIHWLAPSRIGATIVLDHARIDWTALDTSTAAATPPLSLANRRHFAALVAVLAQHDLAVVVDNDGSLRKVAVGLRWSDDAERVVDNQLGMRHRSAQRFSRDHPATTVIVVSEDGPVTAYRSGVVTVTTRNQLD